MFGAFFNLVIARHTDAALGLRIFHPTILYTQYYKYKGNLSHFHLTNHIPFYCYFYSKTPLVAQ